MKLFHAAALVGMSTFFVTGCALPQDAEEEELVIVAPGKEDNFFSNVAKEYLATAQVAITLDVSYKEKSEAEQLARAGTIMEGKTKQIAWFLHVYVIDKSDDDDAGDYGGLRAMVLDGSHDGEALKQDQDDPLKFSYTFEVQVGGSHKLLDKIRDTKTCRQTVRPSRCAWPSWTTASWSTFRTAATALATGPRTNATATSRR